MGDNRTYIPGTHCAVCVQFGRSATAATKTVAASDGRLYQLCTAHGHVFDTYSDIYTAVAHLRPTTKGNPA